MMANGQHIASQGAVVVTMDCPPLTHRGVARKDNSPFTTFQLNDRTGQVRITLELCLLGFPMRGRDGNQLDPGWRIIEQKTRLVFTANRHWLSKQVSLLQFVSQECCDAVGLDLSILNSEDLADGFWILRDQIGSGADVVLVVMRQNQCLDGGDMTMQNSLKDRPPFGWTTVNDDGTSAA